MKVFISWSGELSRGVAALLRTWLECVLQNVKPWMSDDIDRGALWFTEIALQLREASVGIICLTRANREAPWVMFEAGALAKGIEKSRICTLLIDLTPPDVGGPLAQFNHATPDRDGLWQIVQTLNRALGDNRLKEQVLESVFDAYWPRFERTFQSLIESHPSRERKRLRTTDDKLNDILYAIRGLERVVSVATLTGLRRAPQKRVLTARGEQENDSQVPESSELLEEVDEDVITRAFSAPRELLELARKAQRERPATRAPQGRTHDVEVDVPLPELLAPK